MVNRFCQERYMIAMYFLLNRENASAWLLVTKMLFTAFMGIISRKSWLGGPRNLYDRSPLKAISLSIWTITFESSLFFECC